MYIHISCEGDICTYMYPVRVTYVRTYIHPVRVTCMYICTSCEGDMYIHMYISVVAITGVSQSTTIAIILVSKHYDYHYHYGSPLKQSITIATTFLQLQLQLLITDLFLDACKRYYTLPRCHMCGDLNHVIDVIFPFHQPPG